MPEPGTPKIRSTMPDGADSGPLKPRGDLAIPKPDTLPDAPTPAPGAPEKATPRFTNTIGGVATGAGEMPPYVEAAPETPKPSVFGKMEGPRGLDTTPGATYVSKRTGKRYTVIGTRRRLDDVEEVVRLRVDDGSIASLTMSDFTYGGLWES